MTKVAKSTALILASAGTWVAWWFLVIEPYRLVRLVEAVDHGMVEIACVVVGVVAIAALLESSQKRKKGPSA